MGLPQLHKARDVIRNYYSMQKIELKNNLTAVVDALKSKEIIDYLGQAVIEKEVLLRLLIESKAGYDQALTDPLKQKVFNQFETSSLYSTQNFSNLFSFVTTVPNNNKSVYFASTVISVCKKTI